MKIAFILPSLSKTGPGIQVFNIINGLLKNNASVGVFYLKDSVGEKINFPCYVKKLSILGCSELKYYDIVHSNGFFPDFLVACLRVFYHNVKYVTTMHNFIKEDFKARYSGVKLYLYTNAWFIILKFIPNKFVFTQYAKEYYSKIASGFLYQVGSCVPISTPPSNNFIDDDMAKILAHKNSGYKIIGSNSIISKIKGLDLVVRALPAMENTIAVFIGGGEGENNLIALSRKLGVRERCYFLGFKHNPLEYLKLYDVYVMPSLSESFGLSMLEAVSHKVPVVCSKIPVFLELFTDDEVFYCNMNEESFIACVDAAASKGEAYSARAFDRFVRLYTTDIVAKNYISAYAQLK
ncbi:glycosyltransferase family 4 protein [Hafnia alvei]|uniref:glycosyltransferase family 4 protein n=1 Tax=Hafnia alvei TaxID=569 RepID=UPI004044201F